MNDNAKILGQAVAWRGNGRRVVLATVVAAWGSSPRPVGSRLAVDEGGHFMGSVSGGCVEGEVLVAADEAMDTGRPILLEFGVSDDKAWSVGLACGGAINVLVEPFDDAAFFAGVVAGLGQGRSTACVVAVESGQRSLLDNESLRRLDLDEKTCHALRAAEGGGRDRLVETPAGKFFVEFWRPPLRLFIVGAVHIAQALAPIAATAGYEVTVIDPRGAFATPERFASVDIRTQWPDDFFAGNPLDESAAVVALTHESRIDDPALIAALGSPAFYIGALGSRGSAEKRRQRLRGQNFDESALARIHGPIGLPIGAATPAEIAIAIAAEMTAALRRDRTAGAEEKPDVAPKRSAVAPKRLAAVVLAAGQSARMGANKLLLPLNGKPVLGHVVESIRAAGMASVVVVLGHEAEEIRASLAGDDLAFALNESYRQGLASSLKCGLAAVPEDCDGAMIFLGDMPDVDPELVKQMMAAFDPAQKRAIVVPVRGGRQGHPVLWGRRFFPLLKEKLSGDSGARHLIGENAEWVVRVEAAHDGIFADLDTPEAFRARAYG